MDSDVGLKILNLYFLFINNTLYRYSGRETGIRTLGTLAGTTDFESIPFVHSGTSPRLSVAGFTHANPGVQGRLWIEVSTKRNRLSYVAWE